MENRNRKVLKLFLKRKENVRFFGLIFFVVLFLGVKNKLVD